MAPEHQANAIAAARRVLREAELGERLSVVSLLIFGGRYPNIDRWAMTAGRYEGAKAEEAVPFLWRRPSILAWVWRLGTSLVPSMMQGEDNDWPYHIYASRPCGS